MTDAHVHLDKGELSPGWVNQFVDRAVKTGINTLYLLKHTNVFSEFMPLCRNMKNHNEFQYNWVLGKEKNAKPLSWYTDFISDMREHQFPIKVLFGLEVCYEPGHESLISDIISECKFDFVTGSIHSVDGWAFSNPKQKWTKDDVDAEALYHRYY